MIKATSSAHISAEKLVLGLSQLNISCNWLNIALLTTASTESVTGTSTVAASCASCYMELAHPSLFHKDKLPSKKNPYKLYDIQLRFFFKKQKIESQL